MIGIRHHRKKILVTLALVFVLQGSAACADGPSLFWQSTEKEDYAVDREAVFEFAKTPSITRNRDRVTISFETRGFCDVTVVVEDRSGTILRHLASGVLGPNAPAPFKKGSKSQTLVWDGKNDLGRYVDEKDKVVVRVSLGLKPQFEKTLFWHPKKRCAFRRHPRAVAQPEGVYIYDGGGVEQIKLFSHEGKYIRTVYPFPSEKVTAVKGLKWNTFADGHKAPKHQGYWQATYLPSGTGKTLATWGTAARAFAVHNGRIAVVPGSKRQLARLRTDGTTGDTSLYGPAIKTPHPMQSAAFSPDGEWLYLAGPYINRTASHAAFFPVVRWKHGVYRMKYAGNESPKLWLGSDHKAGRDDKHFDHPYSVCVDAKGRVYVADNQNDRVQIFSPDGKLVKSLPVKGPAILKIHHKTQELYCFCWTSSMGHNMPKHNVPARLSVYDPLKSPRAVMTIPLPLKGYRSSNFTSFNYTDEMPFRIALDSYTDPVTIWMIAHNNGGRHGFPKNPANFRRYRIKDGKLVALDSWSSEVARAVVRWQQPDVMRQRLLVDQRSGMLYSMEQSRVYSKELVQINPENGKVRVLKLPHRSDDYAIDHSGHLYLRNNRLISRFDISTMREVPFDYGEERGGLISVLVLPGNRTANWIEPGMSVTPQGEIVVSACNFKNRRKRAMKGGKAWHGGAKERISFEYVPTIYPGRQRYGEVHIFDRHGKVVGRDMAAQGMTYGHGTFVDPRGDIYYHVAMNRMYGKKAFYPLTGCVMKFKRGKGRFLSRRGQVTLPRDQYPETPQQIAGFWVRDVEWIYPGVGFSRNRGPCTCWDSEMALDYFGRSFIPTRIRNQVAILDTNGNLIMHVGKYGNVDDGKPLVPDKYRARPPRSIGGDEVGLMYANFTAVHNDKRLFISDTGNSRILSVQLGYHTDHKTPLRNTPDLSEKKRDE